MSRFGPYRTAQLALFVHGSATALLLDFLLGQTYILDLYRGMNLKLPQPTRLLMHFEPIFSVPGVWIALTLVWAGYLSRISRQPSLSDRSLSLPSDDTSVVETFLGSHILLCCLLMLVSLGLILPFYQLIGCLC